MLSIGWSKKLGHFLLAHIFRTSTSTSMILLTKNLVKIGFLFIYLFLSQCWQSCKSGAAFNASVHREGRSKHCFCPSVCPHVRPSVAYIANNSITQRPSVPKFWRKVPRLWCDSHTSFKVKRSGSPAPLMLTHMTSEWQGLRSSNLVYGWRTTTHISHRRHGIQSQRSRSQGHVISLSRVGLMAHESKTNSRSITKIGGGYSMTRATLRTSFNVKGQGHRPANADTQNVPYLPYGKV